MVILYQFSSEEFSIFESSYRRILGKNLKSSELLWRVATIILRGWVTLQESAYMYSF